MFLVTSSQDQDQDHLAEVNEASELNEDTSDLNSLMMEAEESLGSNPTDDNMCDIREKVTLVSTIILFLFPFGINELP